MIIGDDGRRRARRFGCGFDEDIYMVSPAPPCKHHEICGLSADISLPPEDTCILHSEYPDKPQEAFDNALESHRQNNEKGRDFSFMIFPRTANFSRIIFEEIGVKFVHAKFLGPANFSFAQFKRFLTFSGAEFHGWASFEMVEFQDAVNFNATRFNTFAHFRGAKFLGGISWESARFNGETTFEACQFRKNVHFEYAVFTGRTLFSPLEGHVNSPGLIFDQAAIVTFRNITFVSPGEIIFRETDLTKCLLLNADVRKVQFSNVIWPQINDLFEFSSYLRRCQKKLPIIASPFFKFLRRLLWKNRRRWTFAGRRFCVYDEVSQFRTAGTQPWPKIRPWPQLERVYRQLKQNYEDQKDFQRANDFHYGEKEARRKNLQTDRNLKILLTGYWLFSGYGERALRPLFWIVFLTVFCAASYLLIGLEGVRHGGKTELVWEIGYSRSTSVYKL